MKDLYRWTFDPLGLLDERARTTADDSVIRLNLWRPVLIGYSPAWNRALLSDVDTFRSEGSLSGLTPYLRGGVVALDQPAHDPRRRVLNPHVHLSKLSGLGQRLENVAAQHLPKGRFEALGWAREVVQAMLNEAFFASRVPNELLAEFLAPLDKSILAAVRPRPILFRRMRSTIAALLRHPPEATICAVLHHVGGESQESIEELRVALAAGYDTTAHTLGWAAWKLAQHPQWQNEQSLPAVIDEILRLYPAGWLGSRVAARATTIDGIHVPRGALLCYSPYLTHRDPRWWTNPDAFQPERFEQRPGAWSYLPFGRGSRTCLGTHLAGLMLNSALTALLEGHLVAVRGNDRARAGITLRPVGPLWIDVKPRGMAGS